MVSKSTNNYWSMFTLGTAGTDVVAASAATGPVAGASGDDVLYADWRYGTNDVFAYLTAKGEGHDVILNFDNLTGNNTARDTIDLRAAFDSLGGIYNDGNNDFADRQAAVKLTAGDFDGDGQANDVKLTINGVSDFSVTFVKPLSTDLSDFTIAQSLSAYTPDIVVGGTTTTTPTTSSTSSSTPSTPSSTTTGGSTGQVSTSPQTSTSSSGLFQGKFPAHYARLDNGINIERSQFAQVSDEELRLLKSMGVEHVRIFINPDEYLKPGQAFDPNTNSGFQYAIQFMHRAIKAGLAVDFGPTGATYHPAYLDNPNDQASINQTISLWKQIATYVSQHFKPTDVFLEIANEPFMRAGADAWWKIAGQIATAVRQAAPDFTIIVPSNGSDNNNTQWSFINSLVKEQPLPVSNVVYAVHYYDPMNFTHQGATWAGDWAIGGAHYPGAWGVNATTIMNDMAKLDAWAEKNGVFATVNEFGSIKFAPDSERAQYFSDVRAAIEKYGLGWAVWDFDKAFSIVQTINGVDTVKDVFQKALTWGSYQDGGTTYDPATASGSTSTGGTTASTGASSGSNSTTGSDSQPSTNGGLPSTITADSTFNSSEKFVFTTADMRERTIIKNFDSITGYDTDVSKRIHDMVDLSKIFQAMGGQYTDGINDAADRAGAVKLTLADLDKDGVKDDTLLTINGLSGFSIEFHDSYNPQPGAYTVSATNGLYTDILIA